MDRRAVTLTVAVFFAAALGSCAADSSAPPPPDFTSLSQLNAIWTLNGTVAFDCNGVAEHETVSGAKIVIFGGAFDEHYVGLPTAACGIVALRFQGAIDLTGALNGNVSTTSGNPILSDTISATCSSSSCSGQSSNSALLAPFSLSNTKENVYDATSWQLGVRCSDGNQMLFTAPNTSFPSIGNGGTLQGSGSTCSLSNTCTASGSTATGAGTFSLSGTVTADGVLSATITQGAGGSLTFSGGPSSSLTSLGGTGTFGSTISLTQCSLELGSPLPACGNCISTR